MRKSGWIGFIVSSMCFYTDYMFGIVDLRIQKRKDMRKLSIVRIFKLDII